ncbi:hypothetical protein BN946_scf184787.g8 [Trametes cinnabarina]|uniref:DUF6534 domain-containing protein n=1 Tax=Pycnoporus cinnabarinus TaxID=5643 RepID=A0A060SYQ2_PYCCI|nr:hypothetical protein BN946_scf184787.g8 [Trametes cinnabarina]
MAAATAFPPELISVTKESLGYQIIGGSLSTAVFGITVLQAYVYYRRYGKDSLSLKSLVAVLVLLDTLTTIFTIHGLYSYVVDDYLNPPALLFVVWPMRNMALGYFCQRLWILSRKNIAFTGLILLLALGNIGAGIGFTALMQINPSVFTFGTTKARILIGVCNGCSSLCDILIASGLCYYLHTGRSGVKQSNKLIDKLMLYAIQRGVLTTVCQILHLATSLALPKSFIFMIFVLPEGKLYTNCFLATLNVRQSLTNPDTVTLDSMFNTTTVRGSEMSHPRMARLNTEDIESKITFAEAEFKPTVSQASRA